MSTEEGDVDPESADVDPPQGTTITMQATTFGNSRVNQVGRHLRVTTGE